MNNGDGQVKNYHGNMKRLAQNTILLYFRQLVIMLVTLYTARVVLQVLGASDYGIYSVVASFVGLFGIISGAISVAITRYMAMAVGVGNSVQLRRLYSTSVWLQLILGVACMMLIISLGSWYIYHIMVIPSGREGAAFWAMAFSAVFFFISLLCVPYNALIIAHEDMKAFAYIALVEAGLKLLIVFLLQWVDYDHLIVYGLLTLLAAFFVRMLYMVYCKRHYVECVVEFHVDWQLFRDMLGFIQWAFLGNGAVVLREQGISMILNLFTGTTVNAARGIAQSVNGAVASFTQNYIQAAQPQITKLFGAGQRTELCEFICRCSRYSFFLMFLLSLPLMKNIDYILSIWLGEYPELTAVFIVWTLLDGLVNSINQPLLYGTLAEGHIKIYEITLTTLYVASLPLSYGILSVGFSPVVVYVLLLVLRVGVLVSLLQQSHLYGMRYRLFASKVLARLLLVSMVAGSLAYWLDFGFVPWEFLRFILETVGVLVLTMAAVLFLGVDGAERGALWSVLQNRISWLRKAGKD